MDCLSENKMALAAFLFLLVATGTAQAVQATPPDNQQSVLEIKGSGVEPLSKIGLSVGKAQTLYAESDKSGNFTFSGLKYYSFMPLTFQLDIPPSSGDLVDIEKSSINVDFDPYGSLLKMSGKIAPAGSIAVNIDGVEAQSQIAGVNGDIHIQLNTPLGLSDGTSRVVANIINVGESCCPRMTIPAPPIQLAITSLAVAQGPVTKENNKNNKPSSVPVVTAPQKPSTAKEPEKQDSLPKAGDIIRPSKPEQKDQKKTSPKVPYLVTGAIEQSFTINTPDLFVAASFPSAAYDATWVGGFKHLTDQLRGAIAARAMMIGAFLDGRSANASLSIARKLDARTLKDYQVSDTICKFGTLSRGIAGTESFVDANKLAFSKIILDRAAQADHTLYAEATRGMVENLEDFKAKYCEASDNNNGLGGYCKSTKGAKADLFFNRDTDFTRLFDTALTLDVNFTDNTLTDQEEMVIALFQNLALRDPNLDIGGGGSMTDQDTTEESQDFHQQLAVRQLVGNSFANLVAMKAKGTSQSATYMTNVLTKLGLPPAEATRLIGSNPSYFAQMEILTKKIYQDPSFYANLYDSPANVDRQKVAMKAISLMQDRDFLMSLKRREMLLSELLELRLRKVSKKVNASGTLAD